MMITLRRARLPAGRGTWLCLAVAALLMNTVPFTLLAYGEQRVSSVDAGLWNAATPLLTVPATIWLIPAERPGRRRAAGHVLGFAGVAVLLGAAHALSAAGTGIAYVLNFTVVREAGATIAATVTYVVPVCTTAVGVVMLGERLTVGAVVGAAVILAGAALCG